MKAAVVQLELVQNNRESNLAHASDRVEELAAGGCQLIVLPQMLPSGLPSGDPADWAEPLDGPSATALGALARRCGTYLVWGMLLSEPPCTYDAALATDPGGEVIAVYRRRHLFWREEGIKPGLELAVADVDGLRLGLLLGEDLLYPETVTHLSALGAEAIACPLCAANAQLNRLSLSDFVQCLTCASAFTSVSDVLVASACGKVLWDDLGERSGLRLAGCSTLAALSDGAVQSLGRDGQGALVADLDGAKVRYFRRLTRRGGEWATAEQPLISSRMV